MKGWKSIQPSPILLLAHHKLQFYYPLNDLTRCPSNFSTQGGSEQKSNAGNALGEDVRIIGQKDIEKTYGMTAAE